MCQSVQNSEHQSHGERKGYDSCPGENREDVNEVHPLVGDQPKEHGRRELHVRIQIVNNLVPRRSYTNSGQGQFSFLIGEISQIACLLVLLIVYSIGWLICLLVG